MGQTNTAALDLDAELDPGVNPWQKPDDLPRLGFGDRKTVYAAIKAGQIPSTRIGRKYLVPTWWVRRQLQLDGPD
jgi:excisionase family DNA binding protein